MNKETLQEQLQAHKAEIERIEKLLQAKSPEQRFLELCEGLEMRFDGDMVISFYKNDKIYFQYDTKTLVLWCRHHYVWSVFKKEFMMEYNEVEQFIEKQVQMMFNCRRLTTKIKEGLKFTKEEMMFICNGVKANQ